MNFNIFTIYIVLVLCTIFTTNAKAELRSRQNANSLSHYIVDMLRSFENMKQPFTAKATNVHKPRRGGPFYKRHHNSIF